MAITRDEILARRGMGGGVPFTLPDGTQVVVRGLSKSEAMATRERDGIDAQDNYVMSKGLVEPAMSEQDMAEWAAIEGEAGNLAALSQEVSRLSGMTPGAGKEATKSTAG